MRSITQQTYVLHLTKGFAFLLTDPASQDFLDPKVLSTADFPLKQM